jgi:hypothetical protein
MVMTRTQIEIQDYRAFWVDVKEGVLKVGDIIILQGVGRCHVKQVCVSLPEEALETLPHRLGNLVLEIPSQSDQKFLDCLNPKKKSREKSRLFR